MLNNKLEVSMYRYNPEVDKFPYMKTYSISKPSKDIMVLDLLNLLKEGRLTKDFIQPKYLN